MSHRFFILSAAMLLGVACLAKEPEITTFSFTECEGSYMPYPHDIAPSVVPDSLKPVMINHVGRHGARYPSSPSNCRCLAQALMEAHSLGTITAVGSKLLAITQHVMALSQGRWGALDSLGEAEQRGIATRMWDNYPEIFNNSVVAAISSYVPRCMMSMYAFTHQLNCLNNRMEFITTTGRVNDKMLRPFDVDVDYIDFRKSDTAMDAYEKFFSATCPTSAIERALGNGYPYDSDSHKRELAMAEYYVIAGLAAMGIDCDKSQFFTLAEINALWGCFNMRQYLQRTATALSTVPAEIASALLSDMIASTDAYVDGTSSARVLLRFGHAETLMPLLSLMRIPGCYYVTDNLHAVARHWQNFHVVPMAANLQIILFKSDSGNYYVRFDLNEQPVVLLPDSEQLYLPWNQARKYLMSLLLP